MLHRVGSFHQGSTMQGVCSLCPKFNDALNDLVAKIDQRVMTINSCNTYDHFDKRGDLSLRGRTDFWYELDDLISRFDIRKIKLLPNPKNPPQHGRSHTHSTRVSAETRHHQHNDCEKTSTHCKLPTPPPMSTHRRF